MVARGPSPCVCLAVSIMHEDWCWRNKSLEVDVLEDDVSAVEFRQTGYMLRCALSHAITLVCAALKGLRERVPRGADKTDQLMKALATKRGIWIRSPGPTQCKERTKSCKLSSDLHIHAVGVCSTHIHTLTHIKIKRDAWLTAVARAWHSKSS